MWEQFTRFRNFGYIGLAGHMHRAVQHASEAHNIRAQPDSKCRPGYRSLEPGFGTHVRPQPWESVMAIRWSSAPEEVACNPAKLCILRLLHYQCTSVSIFSISPRPNNGVQSHIDTSFSAILSILHPKPYRKIEDFHVRLRPLLYLCRLMRLKMQISIWTLRTIWY